MQATNMALQGLSLWRPVKLTGSAISLDLPCGVSFEASVTPGGALSGSRVTDRRRDRPEFEEALLRDCGYAEILKVRPPRAHFAPRISYQAQGVFSPSGFGQSCSASLCMQTTGWPYATTRTSGVHRRLAPTLISSWPRRYFSHQKHSTSYPLVCFIPFLHVPAHADIAGSPYVPDGHSPAGGEVSQGPPQGPLRGVIPHWARSGAPQRA